MVLYQWLAVTAAAGSRVDVKYTDALRPASIATHWMQTQQNQGMGTDMAGLTP